jgi:hypothetical protein
MGDHFAGITYSVSASASDPDGDTLTYTWSVNGGTLGSTTGNAVDWTMPATPGNYLITVEADDGKGGTDQRTETVDVIEAVLSMEIPIVSLEGGYIIQNAACVVGDFHHVGDNMSNNPGKGYVSFDISGLSGRIIDDAALEFNVGYIVEDPSGFVPLRIHAVNWEAGEDYIVFSDFNLVGAYIQSFSTSSFTCDDPQLKHYIQNAIDAGRSRFQIMIFFTGMATDSDDTADYWGYNDSDISLNVTYIP